MGESDTKVVIGDSHFDLAGVGGWIDDHVWLFVLLAAIGFVFFIFQKGGFGEKLLEHRAKMRELDARALDAAKELADRLRRKYDRDDPYLPFDDPDEVKK